MKEKDRKVYRKTVNINEREANKVQSFIDTTNNQRKMTKQRHIKPNRHYLSLLLRLNIMKAPKSYTQLKDRSDGEQWKTAYHTELDNLTTVGEMKTVKRQVAINKGAFIIPMTEVFVVKYDNINKVTKRKVRICARGDLVLTQKNETYSPVTNNSGFHLFLIIILEKNLYFHQADVSCAFLFARSKQKTYLELPKGHTQWSKDGTYIWETSCAVYGLRTAPRLWNSQIHKSLMNIGFNNHETHPCFYFNYSLTNLLILYVDDMMYGADSKRSIDIVEKKLCADYRIKINDEVEEFLGQEIVYLQNSNRANIYMTLLDIKDHINKLKEEDMIFFKAGMILHQSKKIQKLVELCELQECNRETTPMAPCSFLEDDSSKLESPTYYRSIVGALLHISSHSRPDISFAVNQLCVYMQSPGRSHLKAAKRVVKYLHWHKNLGVLFHKREQELFTDTTSIDKRNNMKDMEILAYCDANYVRPKHEKHYSTIGYCVYLNGNLFAYKSKKISELKGSTCEMEYTAIFYCFQEVKSIMNALDQLKIRYKIPLILNDNKSAINLVYLRKELQRTKHIDFKYLKVREEFRKKKIRLEHISGEKNIADLFTKSLTKEKFMYFRKYLVKEFKV